MILSRCLGCAVLLVAVGVPYNALAQESYNGPLVGLTLSEGPRWGWGAAPAATLGGVGIFGGWRLESVRVGLLEQTQWWDKSHGAVLDVGGFVSIDYASLWLDPQLSAALFVRLEPVARLESSASVWAFAPSLVFGGRAAGIELGFAVTPEFWLSNLPNNGTKLGVDAQVRLGCDFAELTHLIRQYNAKNAPATP